MNDLSGIKIVLNLYHKKRRNHDEYSSVRLKGRKKGKCMKHERKEKKNLELKKKFFQLAFVKYLFRYEEKLVIKKYRCMREQGSPLIARLSFAYRLSSVHAGSYLDGVPVRAASRTRGRRVKSEASR